MGIAGIETAPLSPPRHLSLSHSARDWMVTAFGSVWADRPAITLPDASRLVALRTFLLATWIDEQLDFQRAKSGHHLRRHKLLSHAGEALFAITLIAALLHVAHVGSDTFERVLVFAALVCRRSAAHSVPSARIVSICGMGSGSRRWCGTSAS